MSETPEQRARREIDADLTAAGWILQNREDLDLTAGRGIAVRNFTMKSGFGFADYLLYLDRKAAGAVEAKAEGTLTGVEAQSAKYAAGLPENLPAHQRPLPFLFESNGAVKFFTNGLDPVPRSRQIFNFPRPETLAEWMPLAAQLRGRLRELPPLDETRLWKVQAQAIRNLEQSFGRADPRALILMATGSGKTFTTVNVAYRLLKFANAKRILFLVDRGNLGKCRVHTLLRLPTGIWYSPGVKANVIFFDKKEGRAEAWTDKLWVYDLRTNQHFTLKQKPIRREDFDEFVECYKPGKLHDRKSTWSEQNLDGRWRCYEYENLLKRDKLSLDLFWIKDKSLTDTDALPAPEVLATEIADDLEAALEQFTKIAAQLGRHSVA
jgi:Type III restriction enzyme, res subunit/N-6 DNA Methylase